MVSMTVSRQFWLNFAEKNDAHLRFLWIAV